VNNLKSMQSHEQSIVEHKVRRAVAINALRRIGLIVATEQQTDTDKARLLRWFARYGWIILSGAALLAAYLTGII
jgi:hypothetical protein